METKLLGIILSIVGISGLILALIFMNDVASATHFNLLIACGVLGAITFFAGIRLIPDSKTYDKTVKVQVGKVPE